MNRACTLIVLALVASLAPLASASEIVLVSGEKLIGTIKEIRNQTVVLEHPHLGTLEIRLSSIRLIDGSAPPDPKPVPVRSDTDAPVLPAGRQALNTENLAEPPPATPVGPAGIPEWTSSLEIGLSTQQGRNDDFSGRVRLEINRTDLQGHLRLDAAYRYATARTDKIENEFAAGAFVERKTRRERFTLFAQTRFDADEFQPWKRRLTGSTGLGLRLFEAIEITPAGTPRPLVTLTNRLGAGFRQDYGDVDESIVPEGLAGLAVDWRISPKQTLTATTTYFPDLRDSADYRIVTTAGWTVTIDQLDGISLRLGMSYEYDGITEGDVDHNDLSAFAAFVLTF